MSWATHAIEKLKQGQPVKINPRGNSMRGKINNGDTVLIEPICQRPLQKGDIVLCRVRGKYYLHLIRAINGDRYLIGNNRGGINGWIPSNSIFGVVVEVMPRSRSNR